MCEWIEQIVQNGIKYRLVGEVYYPQIEVPSVDKPVGRWGRMCRRYLKEHRSVVYNSMLLQEKLDAYLAQVDQQAKERVEGIVRQMREAEGVDEALKEADPLEWVRRMNGIRARAEDVVLDEIVYG